MFTIRLATAIGAALASLLPSGALCASTSAPLPDITSTQLIIKFKTGGTSELKPSLVLEQATASAKGASITDFGLFARVGSPSNGQWLISNRLSDSYLAALAKADPSHPEIHLQQYVVLGYPDGVSRLQAERKLLADTAVLSARANVIQTPATRVNDYFADAQYAYRIPQGYQWALESIRAMSPNGDPNATSGWNYSKGWGFVAIVDSGVDVTHPDLQGRLRTHFSQAFYTGCWGNALLIDEAGDFNCPNSARGHGTHVAGLVGGIADNSVGISGVCHFCSLIIAKILNNNTSATSDTINGINHSNIRGAPLINRSGGGQDYLAAYGVGTYLCSHLPAGTDGFCDVLALAARREVTIVAAAGNENDHKNLDTSHFATNFPASEPTVISVGGTVFGDTLWINDYDNGPVAGTNTDKLDFVAPAKRVVSTFYRGGTWRAGWCSDAVNDTSYYPNGYGYDECTGTSMSAPIVTGAFAIARSLNPLLSRVALQNVMQSNGRTVAGNRVTPDMVNAAIALINSNNSLTPVFSVVASSFPYIANRFYTVFPQMATAAIKGTLLPLPNQSQTPVYYAPDGSANPVAGYTAFPDVAIGTPTAYFFAYTRQVVSGVTMQPLRRLSKLENAGNGNDGCGFPMPLPGKAVPIVHTYTTNDTELFQLMSATAGNCYNYDGIEGWIAPSNWTGNLQALYRLYNPNADSFILVPQSKLTMAQGLGYTANQTLLGYVVPN